MPTYILHVTSFTYRKATTWEPTALLPLRRKVWWGFSRPKNPMASEGCEPANLGTKGQHATSRPPKLLCVRVNVNSKLVKWLDALKHSFNSCREEQSRKPLQITVQVAFGLPRIQNQCLCDVPVPRPEQSYRSGASITPYTYKLVSTRCQNVKRKQVALPL